MFTTGPDGERSCAVGSTGGGVSLDEPPHAVSDVTRREVTSTAVTRCSNEGIFTDVAFDESTRVELPWRSGLQAIIGDLVDDDVHRGRADVGHAQEVVADARLYGSRDLRDDRAPLDDVTHVANPTVGT